MRLKLFGRIMISIFIAAVFAVLLIGAGVRDLLSFSIPNWVSFAIALLFIPAALAAGVGWTSAGLHLATGFAVLIIGMGMFAMGWVGGGDAKLLAAVSLWMGWPDVLLYIALVCVLGGAFTLMLIVVRQRLGPIAAGWGLSWPILQRTGDIPYGVAIAGAALLFLPEAALTAALISAVA